MQLRLAWTPRMTATQCHTHEEIRKGRSRRTGGVMGWLVGGRTTWLTGRHETPTRPWAHFSATCLLFVILTSLLLALSVLCFLFCSCSCYFAYCLCSSTSDEHLCNICSKRQAAFGKKLAASSSKAFPLYTLNVLFLLLFFFQPFSFRLFLVSLVVSQKKMNFLQRFLAVSLCIWRRFDVKRTQALN